MARAGVRASAASFEYWPLSHGLLISSGFQASGGSSGHSFQGAVAPVPGRGLQEIACGARQAEVLLGSGLEPEELPRFRGPAVLRAKARATDPAPSAARESGPQGSPFSFSAARVIFLWLEGPARCGRPRGSAPGKYWAPRGFFLWAIQRTGRERKALVQRVETPQGSSGAGGPGRRELDGERSTEALPTPRSETRSFICIMKMRPLYRALDRPILRPCPI